MICHLRRARQDKHLRGRDREGFISGLARHLDAVNHLHPFREGNGRTQRIFFSQLSGRAGYLLRWDRISAEENAAASGAGAAAWPPLLERMTEPLPGRSTAASCPGHIADGGGGVPLGKSVSSTSTSVRCAPAAIPEVRFSEPSTEDVTRISSSCRVSAAFSAR